MWGARTLHSWGVPGGSQSHGSLGGGGNSWWGEPGLWGSSRFWGDPGLLGPLEGGTQLLVAGDGILRSSGRSVGAAGGSGLPGSSRSRAGISLHRTVEECCLSWGSPGSLGLPPLGTLHSPLSPVSGTGGAWGWPGPPGCPPHLRPPACSWPARPRAAWCWGCCTRLRAARRPLSPRSPLVSLVVPSRQSPPRSPPLTGRCSGPSCARSSWHSQLPSW